MKGYEILVIDSERKYVDALVRFLMSQRIDGSSSISVTGISDPEDITGLNGRFSIGIIAEEYLNLIENSDGSHGITIDRVFVLTEDNTIDKPNSIYKYQNMDILCGILSQEKRRRGVVSEADGMEVLGVYSPSKHELSLPYALSLCKSFIGNKEVLFVDLSEIGTLSFLMGERIREDLIDVIYMLENGEDGGGLEKFIIPYEGISVLSPVATPSQLSYITPDQWGKLFEKIKESGFQKVVVLFGSLIQGFADLAGNLRKLIVLKKPGDFYAISDEIFMDYMEKLDLKDICEDVLLPLSAANLTSGSFRLEALINGKLMEFVNREREGHIGKLQGA